MEKKFGAHSDKVKFNPCLSLGALCEKVSVNPLVRITSFFIKDTICVLLCACKLNPYHSSVFYYLHTYAHCKVHPTHLLELVVCQTVELNDELTVRWGDLSIGVDDFDYIQLLSQAHLCAHLPTQVLDVLHLDVGIKRPFCYLCGGVSALKTSKKGRWEEFDSVKCV